ncbi:hypothetical protein HAX54_007933 [Datura stramonium]|uniref:Uncharacterized protein n=1 Tax=Datura stramonium TaxID=4076 RepID=A0ABS8WUZ2_DATST|nr:hypothetical protein [Datura stramonium]
MEFPDVAPSRFDAFYLRSNYRAIRYKLCGQSSRVTWQRDANGHHNHYKRPNLNWEVKVILRFIKNKIMTLKNDTDVSMLKLDEEPSLPLDEDVKSKRDDEA